MVLDWIVLGREGTNVFSFVTGFSDLGLGERKEGIEEEVE